jgi:hypothetical protein
MLLTGEIVLVSKLAGRRDCDRLSSIFGATDAADRNIVTTMTQAQAPMLANGTTFESLQVVCVVVMECSINLITA